MWLLSDVMSCPSSGKGSENNIDKISKKNGKQVFIFQKMCIFAKTNSIYNIYYL